jgi:exonuclease VII small subunit|tara:strand:- start:550 stop:780 length:231 start_codon:yes stop_codon:yes gene_type:complete
MSTVREAHIPNHLVSELKNGDRTIESAIKIYEKQADQALKSGNKILYKTNMQIAEDLRKIQENPAGKTHVNSKHEA